MRENLYIYYLIILGVGKQKIIYQRTKLLKGSTGGKGKQMFKIITAGQVKMVKIDRNSETMFDQNFNPLVGNYFQLKIGEQFELVNDQNVWIIRTGVVTKIELVTNNQIILTTASGSEYALLAL